jgi:protein-S-isoprenylcysteine O-methyltransferase Ste14
MSTKNHPGVYVPPPLIYVTLFFLSVLLQKLWPLKRGWLNTTQAQGIGWLLIALCFLLVFIAIRQFVISKNTVVTIKPATSLQTTGIYTFTRNPMYLGLLLLYSGIAFFYGNWWTFFLLSLLIMIIQLYVIRREEKYLHNAFGTQYNAYKKKVRRWI